MLGEWLGAAFTEFKANWQEHMIPSLIVFGVSFVGSFVMMGILGAFVAVLVIGGSMLGEDFAAAGAILGYGIGLPLFIVGMIAIFTPVMVGYNRVVLRVMRGQSYEISEMFALDGVVSAVVANVVAGVVVSAAAMACYFPAIPVGALFLFTTPLIADRKVSGGLDAVKQSVALARKNFWGLMGYWLVAVLIGMAVAYIPIIGAFLSMPLLTTFILTAYLKLSGEDVGEQPMKALEGSSELVEKDLANPYASPREV